LKKLQILEKLSKEKTKLDFFPELGYKWVKDLKRA